MTTYAGGFYTNVAVVSGSAIGLRGVDKEGRRFTKKVRYSPTLFNLSKVPTKFQTFDGKCYLEPKQFKTIWDAKMWREKKEDVAGATAYGNPRFEYAFLTENYPQEIEFDSSKIYVANIDIEVKSDDGFPEPEHALQPVVSITLERDGNYVVWGLKEFKPHLPMVTYIQCDTEENLLRSFLAFWCADYPDVVTGWNISKFDIPYLVHRITKILSDEEAKKMSPWEYLSRRRIAQFGKEYFIYQFSGLDILDYMDLFKKFSKNFAQENYQLDTVAEAVVGEKKLDYGNRTLAQLYEEDFQKFIEYNIHDTTLIRKIDNKEKLMELAFSLAYQSHTNPSDVFSQVRMWTQIIDDYLARQNKFSTALRYHAGEDKERFEGAFVKEAMSGMFNWVVSFDATSLYPSLIMQHNISPDTFIDPKNYTPDQQELMAQKINVDTLFERKVDTNDLSDAVLCANGHLFTKKKKGFLPCIIEDLFAKRQKIKGNMIIKQQEVEAAKASNEPADRIDLLKNDVARFDALQNAIKTCLNSSFGAMGNQFFFHYDVRYAEAITITGKLTNKWATRAVNDYINKAMKTNEVDYVIAGDTDSMYVNLGPLVRKVFNGEPPSTQAGIDFMDKLCGDLKNPGPLGKVLIDAFDEFGDYLHVVEQKIYFKREALADRALWTGGKKRYVVNVWDQEHVRYTEPKIKIKGFEMVKTSHPKICRNKMKEATKVILTKTEPELWDFVRKFEDEFRKLPVEQIAFPRSCNDLKKYEDREKVYKLATPQNIKAALVYNNIIEKMELSKRYPKIESAQKIKFVKLKTPNPIFQEVIGFPFELPKELDLHKYIDYDSMFAGTFLEPLHIILDAIGWHSKQQRTLGSLFKKDEGK